MFFDMRLHWQLVSYAQLWPRCRLYCCIARYHNLLLHYYWNCEKHLPSDRTLSLRVQQLAGITSALHIYAPPSPPMEVYTQSYWYAVMAAALYLICSMLLMLNLLGYLLGHYPQNFNLNDDQRILIVQTILFFVWLAAGSAVFSHIERRGNNQNAQDWTYVDAVLHPTPILESITTDKSVRFTFVMLPS